jgi:hypothetical protein
LRRGEGFRFDSVGRTLFGRFLWQIGDDAFRGGGTEGLSDGLLATASTSSASSSSPTSASPAFSASALRARWLAGVGGLFARGLPFNLRFGGGRNFSLVVTRLKKAGVKFRRPDVAGLWHCVWGLLGIKICRLQWRRRRLTSRLRVFLLTAL